MLDSFPNIVAICNQLFLFQVKMSVVNCSVMSTEYLFLCLSSLVGINELSTILYKNAFVCIRIVKYGKLFRSEPKLLFQSKWSTCVMAYYRPTLYCRLTSILSYFSSFKNNAVKQTREYSSFSFYHNNFFILSTPNIIPSSWVAVK
jgi:hypothetical protein